MKAFYIILICAIPVTTLALTAVYHFSYAYQNPREYNLFPSILTSFAALTSLYALLLIIHLVSQNLRLKTLIKRLESLEQHSQDSFHQMSHLQSKIDLLSTLREISLVAKEDVEFEVILKKALELIAQFIPMKQGSTDEITIFLKEEKRRGLFPKARWRQGETCFDDDLKNEPIDNSNVAESLEHQRLFLAVDGERFDLTLPLVADREALGAIKIKISLEGTPTEKTAKIKELQSNLQELVKILALAIKTPHLYSRTITDGLTGLFSKRHFFTQLQTAFEQLKHHPGKEPPPLSLLMIDLDHFKSVNDTYGHPVGDEVLKTFARLIKDNLRLDAMAFRYGGEEVAVILPGTDQKTAFLVAERLRKKMENLNFTVPKETEIKLTISIGLATISPQTADPQELVNQADNALYEAKQTGRNKTCIYQ